MASATAANTLSNNAASTGGSLVGRGGLNLAGSTGNISGIAGSGGGPRFSKPTKAVSFAGDEDEPDHGGMSGRTALEVHSPNPTRSSSLSPLRGSRVAVLPQAVGYGGANGSANGSANGAAAEAAGAATGVVPEGLVSRGDGYGWGLDGGSTTSGDTEPRAPGVGAGGGETSDEDEDEDEEAGMAHFIVLDCSKVTNVSVLIGLIPRSCFPRASGVSAGKKTLCA